MLSTWKLLDCNYKSMERVTVSKAIAVLHVLQTYFFYPYMSFSALRMPLQQGCKQGTHPGQLYSSWMLYPTIWNHTWMGQLCLGVHV